MKNIFCLFLGIVILSLSSCFKIDNWDEPDCTFYGTVYDSYTGEPLLASQDDWQIKIWERTWKGHPGGATASQDLRIKQDGTYQNTKLFAGTYDMLPDDGPFWIADTTKSVVLKGKIKQDFTVTPYMIIDDFTCEMKELPRKITEMHLPPEYGLWVKWRVRAPLLIKEGREIPNLRDIKLFLSLSTFCGQGSNSRISLSMYDNDGRLAFSGDDGKWSNIIHSKFEQNGAMEGYLKADQNTGNDVDTSPEYDRVVKVKAGYTYFMRVGACTTTGSNRYNYSKIKRLVVSSDGKSAELFDL